MNKYDFKRGAFLLVAIIFLTTMLLNLIVTLKYVDQLKINVNDYIDHNGKKYEVSNVIGENKDKLVKAIQNTNVVHLESRDGFLITAILILIVPTSQ